MSVSINAFYDPDRGEAVRFENIGDGISGVILDVALIDDQHNAGKQLLTVKISQDGDVRDLYVRSAGQKEAIGQAVMDAGTEAIDVGGRLSISYVGDKLLKNGRQMKLYSATYEVPPPIGTASFGDEAFE